jgi:hypothetical protein
VTAIRAFYGDSQEFHFPGRRQAARLRRPQTQHVVASYRPVSTVIHFSCLLHEKFAGTPYAKHFLGGE